MANKLFGFNYFREDGVFSENNNFPNLIPICNITLPQYKELLDFLNDSKVMFDSNTSKIIIHFKNFNNNNSYISYSSDYWFSYVNAVRLFNEETVELILQQLEFNSKQKEIEEVWEEIHIIYNKLHSMDFNEIKNGKNLIKKIENEVEKYKNNFNQEQTYNKNIINALGI